MIKSILKFATKLLNSINSNWSCSLCIIVVVLPLIISSIATFIWSFILFIFPTVARAIINYFFPQPEAAYSPLSYIIIGGAIVLAVYSLYTISTWLYDYIYNRVDIILPDVPTDRIESISPAHSLQNIIAEQVPSHILDVPQISDYENFNPSQSLQDLRWSDDTVPSGILNTPTNRVANLVEKVREVIVAVVAPAVNDAVVQVAPVAANIDADYNWIPYIMEIFHIARGFPF